MAAVLTEARTDAKNIRVEPTVSSTPKAPETRAMTLRGFYVTERMMGALGLADAAPGVRVAGVKAVELRYLAIELLNLVQANLDAVDRAGVVAHLNLIDEVAKDFRKTLSPGYRPPSRVSNGHVNGSANGVVKH